MTLITDSKEFIENEFKNLNFGDERINKRALNVAQTMNASPASSIPKMSSGYDTQLKAIYRFFQNDKVTDSKVLQTHYDNTLARMSAFPGKILLLNDSCFVTPTKSMDGLLTRGKGVENCVRTHYCLAISDDGKHIFGILDYFVFTGKTKNPFIEDESDIWLLVAKNSIEKISEIKGLLERCLYVGDREADDFALIDYLTKRDLGFVIRSQYNRSVMVDEEEHPLFEALGFSIKHGGKYSIKTLKESTLKEVEVQRSVLRNIVVKPPQDHNEKEPIELNMVHVIEEGEVKQPVSWRLWTTENIENSTQSSAVVDYYSNRWKIEEVNKGAKTGVKVEERQFTDLDHFLPFLAMAFVIGWRIVALRNAVDINPDLPVKEGFTADEADYLRAESNKAGLPMSTIKDAIFLIAKLGGFTNRYPRPGWQILWQGWMTFYSRVEGFILAKSLYG